MKLKSIFARNLYILAAMPFVVVACTTDKGDETGPGGSGSGDKGYADPNGVFIVNEGPDVYESGSLVYIAPDGTASESDPYETVNHSRMGYMGQDMYLCDGKYYILCQNETYDGGVKTGDGQLIVVDAKTLTKLAAYDTDELRADMSETDDDENILQDPTNVVVLDEHNVFICDNRGMSRFDCTTKQMVRIEGTYRWANNGSNLAGNIGSQGIAVIGDRIYAAAGGWSMATADARFGIYEFTKGATSINRELSISNSSNITGLCADGGYLWVATTIYEDEIAGTVRGENAVYKVDPETMSIVETYAIRKGDLSLTDRTSSITVLGDNIYYTGGTTSIYRFNTADKSTTLLGDATAFDPAARVLYNNIVVNPANGYVYMTTIGEYSATGYTTNNILVFDVSGDKLELVANYKNLTCFPAGIVCVSRFE